MQLRIAVCDDEEIYQTSIIDFINQWVEVTGRNNNIVIKAYKSGEDLLYDLEGGAIFNLLFLDIEIPGEQNGFLTAKQIYTKDPYTNIVFVTNYSEFACSGYEVNALRYIMKPFGFDSIKECLDITWHKLEMTAGDSIIISDNGSLISVPVRNIVYAESLGHTLHILTSEGNEYNTRLRLSDFTSKFPASLFIQCHRSYAVNLMYIRKITHSEITLLNKSTIPLSRKYEKQLYLSFLNYHQGGGKKA